MRWQAAACAALLVAMVAWAQTNTPMAVTLPANAASATAPSAGVISEGAPPPSATNTVSLIEMIQNDGAFQSYTNLLEHSLFVPASEIGGSSAGDTGPTFAGGLRLTGIVVRGVVAEASIEDRNDPDKRMFVKTGDVIPDTEIKVVGFDLRGRALLLKKGDEEGRLEYEMEAAPAPATAGKPPAPGMPSMPPPQGAMMSRPGMPPSSQPAGAFSGARPGGGGGFRNAPPSATASGSSGSSGNAGQQTSRREQRQQQIARLQQVMQSTADPAAKQRLQSYIQMLEKANAQE